LIHLLAGASPVAPAKPARGFKSAALPSVRMLMRAAGIAIALGATAVTASEPSGDMSATQSLDACITTALRNNHRHPASQFAVAIAEAQHAQALAGYWPQLQLTGGYRRADEPPNFLFPASVMGVPGQSVAVPASTATVTVPAGVLGPTAVQLPVSVPAQTLTTAAQAFPVPAQEVKLMNADSLVGSVSVQWLLFDGGMRHGLRTQTTALVDAMKQEARRTDLEIVDAVTRLYYGAVLARQLRELGNETLERMDATLRLTETLYQEGSGKVTKADYLENKVMVESLRAIVAELEKNEAMARAALANTMGLPWQASVAPADREIPFAAINAPLAALVGEAYEFNPDWKRLEAGLRASDGAVETARSGYFPRLALTGDLHAWNNGYDAGIATAQNKRGWTAGIGIEIPLFDGFLTRGRVAEARARLSQLQQQQLLLKEGLGLQIKDTVTSLEAATKAYQATLDAKTAATENRDLNVRAYQSELVDTEKVIRAQLTEAFMAAQHCKVRYDHAALRSQLVLLVGTGVGRQFGPAAE
jgi:outer membrane protein TolC